MWTIQLLGGLAARSPQRMVSRFRTHKAGALLAYLAFYRDKPPHPREILSTLLWPDTDLESGRHNLSAELTPLRHLLEPAGIPPGSVLQADRFTVRLNLSAVTTDVHLFDAAAARALRGGVSVSEQLALLRQAADLYQGPLLPGYYEEWIGPESMRLSSRYLQVLLAAAPLLLESGANEQVLAYAHRAVEVDPLSEEATAALLRALAAMGQPGQVLSVYRAFAERFKADLDDEPSPALQHLALQLAQSGSRMTDLAVPAGSVPAWEPFCSGMSGAGVQGGVETTAIAKAVVSTPRHRTQGGAPGVLPTTRFFGREAEIARLSEMLRAPRARLVTLIGPGGIGKTRLAVELLVQLINGTLTEEGSPISCVFIPLADVWEPERLYETILHALKGNPTTSPTPLERIAELLALQTPTLLVLDNFEQLAEEGALLVQQLLERTSVKILVTSRQKLNLQAEQVFQLAPLPTPFRKEERGRMKTEEARGSDSSFILHPSSLLSCPSIALFVDRAQATLPGFQCTECNAAEIAQLCDHLEGIPLALELAAARVGVLSPARILQQVQANRLDFLASRQRDVASRQRTLRATLDWSYQLLPPSGQAFLMQLSVFRGGWTLEAAQAVCEVKQGETLEWLTLLRDSSLIGVLDTEEGLRFTLLETIREYAAEQLERSGLKETTSQRHATYCGEIMEGLVTALVSPEWLHAIRSLGQEQENCRAALGWVEAQREDALQIRLGFVMMRAWIGLNWMQLGRWLSELRAQGGEGADAPTSEPIPELLPDLLFWMAGFGEDGMDLDEAILLRLQLAHLLCQREQRVQAAQYLIMAGQSALQRSAPEAQRYQQEALSLMRSVGNAFGMAIALAGLVVIVCYEGDYERAGAYLAEARHLLQNYHNTPVFGQVLIGEGLLALFMGDLARARDHFEANLALRRRIRDRPGVGIALSFLGYGALNAAEFETARQHLEAALEVYEAIGWDRSFMAAWTRCWLGRVWLGLGQAQRASEQVQAAMRRFRIPHARLGLLSCLHLAADLAAWHGQPAQAARLLGAHERMRAAHGSVLPKTEQEQTEQLRASVAQALGAERFVREERAGQALSEEEAVALALEQTNLPD